MSTAALPASLASARNMTQPQAPRNIAGRIPGSPSVRRRGSLEQGFALETLGHAVEYLVDSRLFAPSDAEGKSDQEAIQVLMRMSREVFSECPEVEPLRRRMGRWLASKRTSARRSPVDPGRP